VLGRIDAPAPGAGEHGARRQPVRLKPLTNPAGLLTPFFTQVALGAAQVDAKTWRIAHARHGLCMPQNHDMSALAQRASHGIGGLG
jgi:hypothetical protein